MVLAAWNRWRLTDDAASGRTKSRRGMVRSIIAESALALLILSAVATWRFTPPPRALAAAAKTAEPAHIHIHAEKAMADITIIPDRVGPVSVSLSILDGEFGRLHAKEVSFTLSNAASGIEPIRGQARHVDGAAWCVDRLTIPASGRLTVRVTIVVDEFTEVTLEDQMEIRPSR